MSEIDFWDAQAQRHFSGYMFRNSLRLRELYPGRIVEAARIVRRHATAWAKECRAIPEGGPPDDGKTLWQMRTRSCEQEMERVLPVQLTEQPSLNLGEIT